MGKSLLSKSALVVGAAVSFLALSWLVSVDRRPSRAFGLLLSLGLLLASGGLMLLWSRIIWSLVANPYVVASVDFSSGCGAVLHTCGLAFVL